MAEEVETEYFWRDFEWEELKTQVESNPSFSHHFQPHHSSSNPSPPSDSDAWKSFHNRHSTGKFFKERRYLLKEFPELLKCDNSKVLEVGCGNGSTVLPMLRGNQSITVYACDCSCEALERTKEVIGTFDEVSYKQRFHPFVCDFSQVGFPNWLACNICRKMPRDESVKCTEEGNNEDIKKELDDLSPLKHSQCCVGGVDFITLIFTLSAIPSQSMHTAVVECISILRPGGLLLFRDYGLYDMTMLRFESNKRVGFREYNRADGTRSYFFSLDTVRDLFVSAGFVEVELEYCCIKSVNRRKGKIMHRVWVHGKFQKPI